MFIIVELINLRHHRLEVHEVTVLFGELLTEYVALIEEIPKVL